ncbi:MAG: hypothetical protein WD036_09565, partial [Bauldia sp.]
MGLSIKRLAAAGFAAVAAIATVPPADYARAGETSERAAEAERLLEAGAAAKALEAFDQAIDAFWRASPLQLRRAVFVDSVAGFGAYAPRREAKFHSGETVTVYLEPVGYGFVADAGT